MADADGSVLIDVKLDVDDAERELTRLKNHIMRTEQSLMEKQLRKNALTKSLEESKRALEELQAKTKIVDGKFVFDPGDAKRISGLKEEIQRTEEEIKKCDAAMDDLNLSVEGAKLRYGEVTQEAQRLRAEQEKTNDAMESARKRAEKSAGRFSSRMKEIISGALFFNLISSGMSQLVKWTGKVIRTNSEATAAIARLKGALLTLAQPIIEVIIPAFTALVNILSKVVSFISELVSSIFGKTAQQSKAAAKALYGEADALDGVGSAAKEAAGSLAGFDEINTIQTENQSGGGGASASSIAPDFSETGDLNWLSDVLGDAAGWVTAALLLGGIALVAIGACIGSLPMVLSGLLLLGAGILVGTETGVLQSWVDTLGLNSVAEFVVLAVLLGGIAIVAIGAAMGNIIMVLAGLGLIGATIFYLEQSGMMESWTEEQLSRAASYVTAALLLGGIALVVIGAAMGNVLMVIAGLGLLAAGIYVGVESGALKSWADALGLDSVFDYVVVGIQLAGIALIAIGAAMANIAMVIAGGIILAAGVAADAIGEETIKNWWEVLQLTTIQQWVGVVLLLGGIALIAIGAAMGNILMILAGFVLLAVGTITSANEGNLKDWVTTLGLEKAAGWVTAGLLVGGIALVIFGILHANILMVIAGLGLLGAGIAVGITSGTFSSWLDTIASAFISFKNTVVDTFTELWDRLKRIINVILAGIEFMANKVIDGINFMTRALNKLSFTVPDWVPAIGGKKFGFKIPSIKSVSIPRLATGGVIPPNREFMAVLGDQTHGNNIEAPEDLIRKIVREETGGNNEIVALLQELIAVERAGRVMKANKRELARTVIEGINDETRMAGKSVLLI